MPRERGALGARGEEAGQGSNHMAAVLNGMEAWRHGETWAGARSREVLRLH